MRLLHEEPAAKHKDHATHEAPVKKKRADRENAPQGKQGASMDRLGNRALLSQMRAGTVQRKFGNEATGQLDGGRKLDASTCALMESRFGESFRDVRLHTGPHAAETADAMHARAFTAGENIVFAEGQYAPESPVGQRLLAHELAHVVQQRRTAGVAAATHDAERDAHEAARDVVNGRLAAVQERAVAGSVQKLDRSPEELAKLDELKRLDAQAEISTLSAADETRREQLREELRRLDDQRLGGTLSAPPPKILTSSPRPKAVLDLPPGMLENLKKQGLVQDEPEGPVISGNVDPQLAAAAIDAMKKGGKLSIVAPPDTNFPFFPSLAPPAPTTPLFLGPFALPLSPLGTTAVPAPHKPAPPPEDPEVALAKKRAREVTALAAAGSNEELVKYFKALDRNGFEQLQNQLGSRMTEIFAALSDFEAVYVGSLGPVKYGRDKLVQKREDYMLRIRKYGSMQSQVFYAWMFSKMSNEEVDALLKQLAADQRLKHTVLASGTEQLQSILKGRGIDLSKYEDRPWKATDVPRGLFEAAWGMVESGQDIRLADTLGMYNEAKQLPPEYQKALDEGLSALGKEYWEFPEKHPFQTAGWALDAMLLRLPSSTLGTVAGVGTGAYHLAEGHVDDAFRDFLPALLVLLTHAGGKAIGGAAASEELTLVGPEFKGGAGRPPLSLPAGATAAGAWEEFFQTDSAGRVFKVVINRSTGTGNVTHMASGKMIFFENGQLVRGPVGSLPSQTAGAPPFDPFALGLPSNTTPVLPGVNPPLLLLPTPGGSALDLPGGGLPLLGPPAGLPVLKGPLPPPPPTPLLVRPGMTLKEMREAQVLKRLFPNSRQLEEKYAAYDGFEGGTESLRYHVDEVKNGQPILTVSRTISGANMISLKELDPAGPGVKGTVEERLVQNVHDAIQAAYERIGKPIVGIRGQTPVTGTTDVYFRTTVENPSKISIVVQVPGTVTKQMETIAKQAALTDTSRLEMPPIEVHVVPVQ